MKKSVAPETGQSVQELKPVFVFNTNSNSPGIVKTNLLHFKCGCEHPKKDSLYLRNKKRGNNGYFCPDHKKAVVFTIPFCEGCGEQLKNAPGAYTAPRFCDDCKRIRARDANRRSRERARLGIEFHPKSRLRLKQPIRTFSVSDSREKGVRCIPCERLFRFHRKIVSQQNRPAA